MRKGRRGVAFSMPLKHSRVNMSTERGESSGQIVEQLQANSDPGLERDVNDEPYDNFCLELTMTVL